MATRQIVEYHNVLTMGVKQFGDNAADIARSARYQYRHVVLLCGKVEYFKLVIRI